MEHVRGSSKASKFAQKDVISRMPDEVITHILQCLPLQDAVKTGILSSYWRSKWTMITQLVFDEDFYEYLQEKEKETYYGRIISRLLLHLKGAITKFDLYIPVENNVLDAEDINNWVMFLSRKGIKEFTLINMPETPLNLHTYLFSCQKLKHLKLYNCYFCPMSSFHGFPNLLSLDLCEVTFEGYRCGEFLTRCPLLEILKLSNNTPGEIKLVEIAKLENLNVLSLPLLELDNMSMLTSSTISRLTGLFPKLQELTLDFLDCRVRLSWTF